MHNEHGKMIELFGIKNCDKVRAARKWLKTHHIAYKFRDIREQPVSRETWSTWLGFWGIEKLINNRSTSWKQLSTEQKTTLNIDKASDLLTTAETLMKRPHLIIDGQPKLLGFSEQNYAQLFLS